MSGQTIRLASPRQRDLATRLIAAAPDNAIVNIREETRSNEQSKKMWAMLSDIARAKPQGRILKTEAWKCLFMDAVGHKPVWEPGIDGGVVNIGYRSSRLTKAEMSEMIECIMAFGAEHDVKWSDQNDQD